MVDPVTNRNCVYQMTVKVLRGVSARHLFQRFHTLKKRLWVGLFSSPSYYIGTAGTLSAATIQRYIERA
jgi:REP-associated tyrosine transposase